MGSFVHCILYIGQCPPGYLPWSFPPSLSPFLRRSSRIAPLPLSVAPSLLRSLPPSPLPLAPSMHSSVPSSLVPFLNPPSLPILPLSPYLASLLPHSIPLLSLPPPPSPCSLTTIRRPSSLLPPCCTQFNVHCVCGWQVVLSRLLLFRPNKKYSLFPITCWQKIG